MGKSLNGKELEKGISQRKDGLDQARFVNRFGKRETMYAKTLNEIRHQLRTEQYEDEKMLNVMNKEMTLDEWYEVGMNTCKKNCRSSTKETYASHYKRIQKELGWIKLTNLNLIILQQAFIELRSDNERKNSKKKVLYVRHTLCYFRKDGKYTFEMHDTKTKNGRRTIPLTQKAYEALRRQKDQKLEIELKGRKVPEEYENLVFVTKNNRPTQQFIVQEGIRACVRNIQKKYPEFEKFSPHCFRHTFATRAIENGMQPKTLQKILGHGSLQMTMVQQHILKKRENGEKPVKIGGFQNNGSIQAGIYRVYGRE